MTAPEMARLTDEGIDALAELSEQLSGYLHGREVVEVCTCADDDDCVCWYNIDFESKEKQRADDLRTHLLAIPDVQYERILAILHEGRAPNDRA